MEDRIILALKPKIDDLDRKVLASEPLGSEDINTLLLQHMFNHIHHLEEDDHEIKVRMDLQDDRMDRQDGRMDRMEGSISLIRTEMVDLRGDLRSEMAELRGGLRIEMLEMRGELRSEIAEVRIEMAGLRGDLLAEMSNLKVYVEKSINRHMLFYVGSVTFLVGGIQLLDRFVPRG